MAVRRRVLLALLIALGAALSLARVIATAPLLIALGATLPPVAVAAVLIFPGRRDPARFTAHRVSRRIAPRSCGARSGRRSWRRP